MVKQQRIILSLDQGTTSSRCIAFDEQMTMLHSVGQAYSAQFPASGWVEQRAEDIWASQWHCLAQVIRDLALLPEQILGITIANQRETTVLWHRQTGQPMTPAVSWQCRRSSDICEQWQTQPWAEHVSQKTGLPIDSYFCASKLRWLFNQDPKLGDLAAQGLVCFGTVDSWLLWNLTQGQSHTTEPTNASRTLLFNIHQRQWDKELLDWFDIPASILPTVRPSHQLDAMARFNVDGTAFQLPILAAMGDQQSALYGQQCWHAGQMKITYGTGCFALINSGEQYHPAGPGVLTTLAVGEQGQICYAREGATFIAGALLEWMKHDLALIEDFESTADLAQSVPSSLGVVCVPALAGLAAPYWDSRARGAFLGLSQGVHKAHMVRAALEALALQTDELLKAMLAGQLPTAVKVDGGVAKNRFVMQLQADLLGCEIVKPDCTEATALGAALLGYFAHYGKQAELANHYHSFQPLVDNVNALAKLTTRWQAAIAAVRQFAS